MTTRLRSFLLSVVAACCFVLCLPLSTAYALLDDYDINDGEVHVYNDFYYRGDSNVLIKETPWYNVTTTNYLYHSEFSYDTVPTTDFLNVLGIRNQTEALFAQNETALLTFNGLTNYITITDSAGNSVKRPFNSSGIWDYRVVAHTSDLKDSVILPDAEVTVLSHSDGTYSVTLDSGTLPFAVSRFDIWIYYDFLRGYAEDDMPYVNGENTYTLTSGWTNHSFHYSYLPASSSITKDIQETVTEVKEELIEVKDGITALPGKMWGVFEDGLTSLMVPDEEAMTSQQDKWNQLLADRFGALYQVGDLVTDYANAFVESEQDTIDIPTVEVPLGEVNFTFGGWTVQIVPDGFEVVIDALKLIVSIACTFLFVNGLKRRFEGLLGGAPSA